MRRQEAPETFDRFGEIQALIKVAVIDRQMPFVQLAPDIEKADAFVELRGKRKGLALDGSAALARAAVVRPGDRQPVQRHGIWQHPHPVVDIVDLLEILQEGCHRHLLVVTRDRIWGERIGHAVRRIRSDSIGAFNGALRMIIREDQLQLQIVDKIDLVAHLALQARRSSRHPPCPRSGDHDPWYSLSCKQPDGGLCLAFVIIFWLGDKISLP